MCRNEVAARAVPGGTGGLAQTKGVINGQLAASHMTDVSLACVAGVLGQTNPNVRASFLEDPPWFLGRAEDWEQSIFFEARTSSNLS